MSGNKGLCSLEILNTKKFLLKLQIPLTNWNGLYVLGITQSGSPSAPAEVWR